MIKALAPLGANNHVSIILAFEGETVTATVIVKPKKGDGGGNSVQFTGTATEVETAIATHLSVAVTKITTSQNKLAELDAQLKAQEEAAKTKTAKKPAATPPPKSTPAKVVDQPGKRGKNHPAAKAATKASDDAPGQATSATDLLDDL